MTPATDEMRGDIIAPNLLGSTFGFRAPSALAELALTLNLTPTLALTLSSLIGMSGLVGIW